MSEAWELSLVTMRWEAMPARLSTCSAHVCCAVRGAVVVLGGFATGVGVSQDHDVSTSRVEMLSKGAGAFVELPPLSCGAIYGAATIAVDETHSALG